MWRKQSEGKPSPGSVAPGTIDSPSYSPSRPASAGIPPLSSAPSSPALSAPSPDAAALTHGIRIRGDLTGKADLFIDGEVEGAIRLGDSRLTVGPGGRVKADIEAREIAVRGHVEGNLRGSERILLGSSCRVRGDIEAPRIVMEEGAQFKGRVEMGPAADVRERQNAKRAAPVAVSPAAPSNVPVTTAVSVPVEVPRGSR